MEREFVGYGSPLTYAYGAEGLAAVVTLHDLLVKTGAREWEVVLLAHTVESKEQVVKHFADLYRFRSELMHGRSLPDPGDPAVAEKLGQGRLFLRCVPRPPMAIDRGVRGGSPERG
jgi:hypothetical protein